MLKSLLPFSHSFLISFLFSFPYNYLFFASICLIVCCYNYSTSLCYQIYSCVAMIDSNFSLCIMLKFALMYNPPHHLFLQLWSNLICHNIPFLFLICCNFATLYVLHFPSILLYSLFISNYIIVEICQRACMLVYNLYCFANLDDFEVGENEEIWKRESLWFKWWTTIND